MGYTATHDISEKEYITKFMQMLPDAKRGGMNNALRKRLLELSPFDPEDAAHEGYTREEHTEWVTQAVSHSIKGLVPDFYILHGKELTIFEIDGSHRTPFSKYLSYSHFADATYGELDIRLITYDVSSDTTYYFDMPNLAAIWTSEFLRNIADLRYHAPKGEFLAGYAQRRHGFHLAIAFKDS